MAAHYDSTAAPGEGFEGACDAAVPCAVALDVARALPRLVLAGGVGLEIVFFDGEEAFVAWTRRDSTYGSRRLAAAWEAAGLLAGVDALVLLDLVGPAGLRIENLHARTTGAFFDRFVAAEAAMREAARGAGVAPIFQRTARRNWLGLLGGGIEDDHTPFVDRGVPAVHLIAHPFPPTWHRLSDSLASVDWPTVDLFNAAVRAAVADYLIAPPARAGGDDEL